MARQQLQEIEDKHKSFREAFMRFVVLDYTLLHSIRTISQLNGRADHVRIKIGKNPYSIDAINIGELNLALERSKFSRINWGNLFSNDPAICDPEYERLEKFLEHHFGNFIDKQFLENCTPKPHTRTNNPKEMKTFSLVQEDHPMSITIEGVIEGSENGNAILTIKNGGTTQQHHLHSERVAESSNLQSHYLYYSEFTAAEHNIATNYAYYRTDLFLQAMLSFRMRFPDSHKELAYTHERYDDHFNYVTNEIERITGTAPPYDVVLLLLKIFGVIFWPLPNEYSEKFIVEELMPAKTDSDLCSYTVAGDMQEVRPLCHIDNLTQAAGLTSLRKELAKLVRNAPGESIEMFGNIISVCKSLFDDSHRMSSQLRFLDSQLPALIGRFFATHAVAGQEVFAIAAKGMVRDFLKKTVTNERLSDLHDLIELDSLTNRTLHFFRSFNDIPRSRHTSSGKDQIWTSSSWYDLLVSHRLDFLYVLNWMLSSDTRLYILYDYIVKRTKTLSDPGDHPEAYFAKRLGVPEEGITSVGTIYDQLLQSIKDLDDALTHRGELEAKLCQYRGRAI